MAQTVELGFPLGLRRLRSNQDRGKPPVSLAPQHHFLPVVVETVVAQRARRPTAALVKFGERLMGAVAEGVGTCLTGDLKGAV